MKPFLVLLTDEQRAITPRVPSDFPGAARKFATALKPYSELLAATEYDDKAALEDLDNVDVLASLEAPLEQLRKMVTDSRLTWLAEAYVPSLEAYGVAKIRAKNDGKLQSAIEPVAQMFSARRTARKAKEPNNVA